VHIGSQGDPNKFSLKFLISSKKLMKLNKIIKISGTTGIVKVYLGFSLETRIIFFQALNKNWHKQKRFLASFLITCPKQSFFKSCTKVSSKKIRSFSDKIYFQSNQQDKVLFFMITKNKRSVKLNMSSWPMESTLILETLWESRCRAKKSI
jgi:hypothetical protein